MADKATHVDHYTSPGVCALVEAPMWDGGQTSRGGSYLCVPVVDSGRKELARASLPSAKHRENVPSSYSYEEEA